MEEDIKLLEEFLSLKTIDNKIVFTEKFLEVFKEPIRSLIARNKELEKQMGKDLDVVYLQGVYNEKDRWKSKVREKIKEYDGLKIMDKTAYEEQVKPLLELLQEGDK